MDDEICLVLTMDDGICLVGLMALCRLNAGGKRTAMTEEQTQVMYEEFDLYDTDGSGEIDCMRKTILEQSFVTSVMY